jgi:hypothetical protein
VLLDSRFPVRDSRFTLAVCLAALPTVQAGPPPQAVQDALLIRLAIELAAVREPTPISLDADGSGLHGVAYDRFALAHLSARAAAASGAGLDPMKPPLALFSNTVVVVAVPIVCGAATVRPSDVEIEYKGQMMPRAKPVGGPAIRALVPGATWPADAIAVRFEDASLWKGETVHITYAAAACPGGSNRVSLPVVTVEPREAVRPVVELAPGQQAPPGPVTLNLGGAIDPDGRLHYVRMAEEATPFTTAALAAAAKMRFEPARINRTPVPHAAGVVVTFGLAGSSDAGPSGPVGPSGSTPDAPGLTRGTSKCREHSNVTYAISAFNAIRIGGGPDAPAREIQYLSALRGPKGEGVKYQHAGQAVAGRGTVLFDRFDLTYAGLSKPIRIYFDPSREEALFAPEGFLCAAALLK